MFGFWVVLYFWMISVDVHASELETIIQGAAQTSDGKEVKYQMVLPSDDTYAPYPNVVRGPSNEGQNEETSDITKEAVEKKEVNEWSAQNPKPFSISPQKEASEIQNTLYEGGDRIYDVQSYPIKDIQTITEPNIDPTITNYPAY